MFQSGLTQALSTYGYIAVVLFVGAESLGIPLPGETMLITAAAYAGATHALNIVVVTAAAAGAAVAGNIAGYAIGWYGGYPLVRRFGRYVRLDEASLKVGRYIFMREGGKVVFFGRFIVVLRTYAAVLAGTNRMRFGRFVAFSIAGGVCWAVVWSAAAYALGAQIQRLTGILQIAFAAAAVVVLVVSIVFVRGHAKRLEAEAEAAFPGPLEGFTE